MKKIWILIHTNRGLIETPEIFYVKKEAIAAKEKICQMYFNPDYDEVEVFEKRINDLHRATLKIKKVV
jgi:hypothetical protein